VDEEALDDPQLRNGLAQVRDRVREMRTDFVRHSKSPQWDMVQLDLLNPLVEVRSRIMEELTKLESKDTLVQIDRDPVPVKYSGRVGKYFELLSQNEVDQATDAESAR